MNPLAFVLFALWLILTPIAVTVSVLKLRRARRLVAMTDDERAVVRRHVQRAYFGLFAAIMFFLVGMSAVAGIVGLLPPTGGVLIAFGLDLALALIILDGVGDLRL